MAVSVIQKLTPSLQTPPGRVPIPVENDPRGERSAAFQRETVSLTPLEIRTRSPSKPEKLGLDSPLPVSVATTVPLEARTTEIEDELELTTQMLVPSKVVKTGNAPTVTV